MAQHDPARSSDFLLWYMAGAVMYGTGRGSGKLHGFNISIGFGRSWDGVGYRMGPTLYYSKHRAASLTNPYGDGDHSFHETGRWAHFF